MNQLVTVGMVLARTDFQEADRIVTILTKDHGKLKAMAKGVRRPKSKLAGGIELFSVSNFTYLPGKGNIGTLISSRLITHYANIVKDIKRTMLGYELLKRLNKATEDATGQEYFKLLDQTFKVLDGDLSLELIEDWFNAQLLRTAGHQPNLKTDKGGQKLQMARQYSFDTENMNFVVSKEGRYGQRHIKLLRLLFGLEDPTALGKIQNMEEVLPASEQLVRTMFHQFIRI
ncbi:MAG TPA: DNA repair protein RecO [Patescibacteria group bacterium]|nr:DNA repair protein RecO [Patescibacteria group bacterium]